MFHGVKSPCQAPKAISTAAEVLLDPVDGAVEHFAAACAARRSRTPAQ